MEINEHVILVDESDQIVGTMEKMEAHVKGKLHRALSVFIFNSRGELLLQQRAPEKYHSGGKWTNTCCSHPRPGEDTFAAANRRLPEEMGLHCSLTFAFSFTYCKTVQKGIIEYEYDHVYFGTTDVLPSPNAAEAAAFRYLDLGTLEVDLENNPDHYTEWLKICFTQVKSSYRQYSNQLNLAR
ncbi:isopentenyl-diphosphate Delta-isomerase [Mucilaginibacter pineti]|nr:isopentenyl-diphosphate Delta-isomerase [Mucilaginibacter pineti]